MTQIIISGAVSFIVAICLTPLLIRYFSGAGLGQEIREDGPAWHQRKRGTPTMGGIAIIAGIVAGYFVADGFSALSGTGGFSVSGFLVLGLTVGLGLVGFADDYIKLAKGRNLGLNKTQKTIGQLAIGITFALLLLSFPDESGLTPGSTNISIFRDLPAFDVAFGPAIVGLIAFVIFINIIIYAWSNAVNMTDGLDGLAAGSTAIVMGAYSLITFWQFRNSCTASPAAGCFDVRDPLDLAVLASAGLGACLGFLWWNAAPAKIFMGDTGSLALGGLVAGLSIASRTELLMIVIGALFVIEVASVVLQVAVFRLRGGARLFRMAPIHHHFEKGGWAETSVVIRFWLIAAMAAMIGIAMFYADWLGAVTL